MCALNVGRVTVGTYEGGVESTVGVWHSRAGLWIAEQGIAGHSRAGQGHR